MRSFKFIIGGLILWVTLLFHEVDCTCRLFIPEENKPLLIQTFGSKDIIIQGIHFIELNEDDEIQAYCATGLTKFDYIGIYSKYIVPFNSPNERLLTFSCKSDDVKFNKQDLDDLTTMFNNTLISQFIPKCKGATYTMFESKNQLPNCENALSYVLGAKLSTPIIIAGLCYDLDGLKLKYVSYKLHEPSLILEKLKEYYLIGLNGRSLVYPLKSVDRLFKFPSYVSIQQDLETQAKTNFWLEIANYELNNIIQTTTRGLKSTLDEFENFFNIIWWRNLRVGNWFRFMQLLDKRSKGVKYNVYTGTSGKLRIPVEKQNCENASSMELELSAPAVIPQFVWTYLQSISKETADDFVVVAYNSPYFEYFNKNSTVICNDMCDEIDWLQPLQNTRFLAALGRLYCCRSDDVVRLLDNLPLTPSNQTNLTTEASVR